MSEIEAVINCFESQRFYEFQFAVLTPYPKGGVQWQAMLND